jgi:hypothetical protein
VDMMHKPTATTEEAMGKMSMYQTEEVYFWKSDPWWFLLQWSKPGEAATLSGRLV